MRSGSAEKRHLQTKRRQISIEPNHVGLNMLYLTRKIGESIVINDDIEVQITEIKGKTVKLGITFPKHARVLRKELQQKIQDENKAASSASAEMIGKFFGG
jgi:carbon storage regulator